MEKAAPSSVKTLNYGLAGFLALLTEFLRLPSTRVDPAR